jgi:hypothetical protein
MKSFVAVAIAMAAVATAQLEGIPKCALPCLLTPLTTDGCESVTDFKCHCEKADSLFSSALPCVEKECEAADQATTIQAVEQACAGVGVPVEVPGGPEESSVAPEPVSSTVVEVSSTVVEVSTTEVPVYPTPSGEPTPSGNGTSPTDAPEPTPTEFPGAATRATAAGLLGAAALAIFAL